MNKPVIEMWPIEKLVPYAQNAKVHSTDQIKRLSGMIKDKGWTSPIQVQKSTGAIIAGHGRRLAAQALGLKVVPVVVIDVDDEDARLMRLADNQLASTDYDANFVQRELAELMALGVNLEHSGFNESDLEKLTTVDFADLDTGSILSDIGEAVETQREENAAKVSETDAELSPLGKAFGFSKLAAYQSRKVKAFMAVIEAKTGKRGAEALVDHIEGVLT